MSMSKIQKLFISYKNLDQTPIVHLKSKGINSITEFADYLRRKTK